MPRILAVDWGERRIGLAVSDDLGILATGLPTLEIRGEAEAVARVADTIRTVEADSVVVGLPLTLKGERGEAARAVERFAEALRRETPVVVSLYDERLTSALAARRMRERGEKSRGRKGRVDQGAAVALLEGWLAKLRIEREGDAT
ncbi:MAG TPA: Holliday junction resolvase RuvX [Verrucomicrobiae bacterium]|nr:Holliday junction resolvase RuvX [Verrucomicrobiae bacterium]